MNGQLRWVVDFNYYVKTKQNFIYYPHHRSGDSRLLLADPRKARNAGPRRNAQHKFLATIQSL